MMALLVFVQPHQPSLDRSRVGWSGLFRFRLGALSEGVNGGFVSLLWKLGSPFCCICGICRLGGSSNLVGKGSYMFIL